MAWNALDSSACVFPVTKATPSVDVKQPRDKYLNDYDKYVYEQCELPFVLVFGSINLFLLQMIQRR